MNSKELDDCLNDWGLQLEETITEVLHTEYGKKFCWEQIESFECMVDEITRLHRVIDFHDILANVSSDKLLNAILNISGYLKENGFKAELLEITKENEIHVYIGNIEVNLGDIQNMEIKLQRLSDIYPKIAEYSGVLDLKDARDNMLDEQYIFKKNN